MELLEEMTLVLEAATMVEVCQATPEGGQHHHCHFFISIIIVTFSSVSSQQKRVFPKITLPANMQKHKSSFPAL